MPDVYIDVEDIDCYAPSVAGKRIEGFYFDSAFTQPSDMTGGKPIYLSDNHTVVYVKWVNE